MSNIGLQKKYDVNIEVIKTRWGGKHIYKVGDEKYESVTKITELLDDDKSGRLIGWAKKQVFNDIKEKLEKEKGNKILIDENFIETIMSSKSKDQKKKEEAADYGTQAHNAIDSFINGSSEEEINKFLISQESKNAYLSFLNMIEKEKIKTFVDTELIVASQKYKYGGTLDAIAIVDSKLCILDWKTSNNLRSSYFFQIGGYIQAFEEQYFPLKIEDSYLCLFSKENISYKIVKIPCDKAKDAFNILIQLRDYVKFIKSEVINDNN